MMHKPRSVGARRWSYDAGASFGAGFPFVKRNSESVSYSE